MPMPCTFRSKTPFRPSDTLARWFSWWMLLGGWSVGNQNKNKFFLFWHPKTIFICMGPALSRPWRFARSPATALRYAKWLDKWPPKAYVRGKVFFGWFCLHNMWWALFRILVGTFQALQKPLGLFLIQKWHKLFPRTIIPILIYPAGD